MYLKLIGKKTMFYPLCTPTLSMVLTISVVLFWVIGLGTGHYRNSYIKNISIFFIYRLNKNILNRYDQTTCVKLCFQKYLFETCSCYDITLPKANYLDAYYASMACSNVAQFKCLNQAKLDFYNNESLVGDCFGKCPMECSKV